jgi:hypothetical protein
LTKVTCCYSFDIEGKRAMRRSARADMRTLAGRLFISFALDYGAAGRDA